MEYIDATTEEIEVAVQQSWLAFQAYRKMPLKKRSEFMRAIADEIEGLSGQLLSVAAEETSLSEARLRSEWLRTIHQLRSYAEACEKGAWMEIRINTAVKDVNPPKPDIRKMLVPLGPVAIFGASNFPFAYSTAGGDTACAFAAGCTVLVKAHPAHIRTSEMIAHAISRAASKTGMPDGIFLHLIGAGNEVGESLVKHPLVKAVGFTGSLLGGKQLFDWAAARKEPIPVFAEMGSVNPVFILPGKLKEAAGDIARMYASSITLSVGQFCTNPGLLIAPDNAHLSSFIDTLSEEIRKQEPATMLHPGIFKNYVERRGNALAQENVDMIAVAEGEPQFNQASPTIAICSGESFLDNPILHQEVFGPFSLIVKCKDATEMLEVANRMEGQLTGTIMGTEEDIRYHEELLESVKNFCGRIIFNGVPTGVEVCLAMQHGGPYPATTDSRFTSVGADGIRRFARPLAFQNCHDSFLPEELRNENPGGIWRTVNNQLTKESIR